MMSSACQNNAKHRMRRWMSGLNPLVNTCAIIVSSHRVPAETCSPWQPTSVKNADRNALRVGPAPRATRLANSLPSSARKPRPRAQVTAMADWNQIVLGVAEVEQVAPRRPTRRLPEQNRVGREEGREHDHVAENEDPKTVAGNDAL